MLRPQPVWAHLLEVGLAVHGAVRESVGLCVLCAQHVDEGADAERCREGFGAHTQLLEVGLFAPPLTLDLGKNQLRVSTHLQMSDSKRLGNFESVNQAGVFGNVVGSTAKIPSSFPHLARTVVEHSA